jgi:hypothetical protein
MAHSLGRVKSKSKRAANTLRDLIYTKDEQKLMKVMTATATATAAAAATAADDDDGKNIKPIEDDGGDGKNEFEMGIMNDVKLKIYKPNLTSRNMTIYELSNVITTLAGYLENLTSLNEFVDLKNGTLINSSSIAWELLKNKKFDAVIDRKVEFVSFSELKLNPLHTKLLDDYFEENRKIITKCLGEFSKISIKTTAMTKTGENEESGGISSSEGEEEEESNEESEIISESGSSSSSSSSSVSGDDDSFKNNTDDDDEESASPSSSFSD